MRSKLHSSFLSRIPQPLAPSLTSDHPKIEVVASVGNSHTELAEPSSLVSGLWAIVASTGVIFVPTLIG